MFLCRVDCDRRSMLAVVTTIVRMGSWLSSACCVHFQVNICFFWASLLLLSFALVSDDPLMLWSDFCLLSVVLYAFRLKFLHWISFKVKEKFGLLLDSFYQYLLTTICCCNVVYLICHGVRECSNRSCSYLSIVASASSLMKNAGQWWNLRGYLC